MMDTFKILLKVCIFLSYSKYCVASIDCNSSEFKSIFAEIARSKLSEDGMLNFTQLATKYGHSAEIYEVVTEDGYILTLFHLPGEKTPVLLCHGLADRADTFLIRGETSMAITLANENYDVWVLNNRGNKFGRRHVYLDPDTDNPQFFNYSFHEIGFFDLAATVDFVRSKTGQDSIATVSHSQGTTAHFVLGAMRPEYNTRIKLAITMAPVAYFNNVGPPLSVVLLAGPVIAALLKSLGINELLQDRKAASNLITLICSTDGINVVVCEYGALFPFSGYNPEQIEPAFLDTIFGHYPSGISRKCLEHYNQVGLRRQFSQYDYGARVNLEKYGTINPPNYNLSAVTMKVAMLVGNNDQLTRKKDVERLRDSLANVVFYKVLKPKLWSHLDFVWALDMPKFLYPDVLELLEKYN